MIDADKAEVRRRHHEVVRLLSGRVDYETVAAPERRDRRLGLSLQTLWPATLDLYWTRSARIPMPDLDRVTSSPTVMGGKPCVRGTRVTVGTLVGLLAAGRSVEEVLAAYPYIERADIGAALSYAAWRTEEVEIPLRAA